MSEEYIVDLDEGIYAVNWRILKKIKNKFIGENPVYQEIKIFPTENEAKDFLKKLTNKKQNHKLSRKERK